jgi:type IV pilus assembly protein PilC
MSTIPWINKSDIAAFIRQLATLVSAGISIIQCCDILEKSQDKPALRLLIYTIKKDILTGKSLHACLQPYPHYFDILTRQLIEISEHTGRLDTMLTMVADVQEKNIAFAKRIKQALFYPCILLITASLTTVGMLLFIVPRFADLFSDSTIPLPLLTHVIFYLSLQLRTHGVLLLCFLVGLLTCVFNYRHQIHINSKLPIFNYYTRKLILARFTRHLAITLGAGIPLLSAIQLTSHTYHQREFTHSLLLLQNNLNAGMQFHQAMDTLDFFPPFMMQMIKIGEESGTLDHMLHKVADSLEATIDEMLLRLNQLLEPLIMLVLGALIGGLVIGMYLPIFNIGRLN